MCMSQCRWAGSRGRHLPLLALLLPLAFLSSCPPLAQGALNIPPDLPQPPVLTVVPTSYTSFSREEIMLPCEASGSPPPTFRWVKDGQLFAEIQHEHSGTLRAEAERPLADYDGVFRCYASNSLGTAVSPPARLIVEGQPVLVKQQIVRKEFEEGQSVVLPCNPPESSTPPTIHWMDKMMNHIGQDERVVVGLNGNLYFSNLLRSDSRDDYMCNAQYFTARTLLQETAVTLSVLPSNDVVRGRKPHFFTPSGDHSSMKALRGQNLVLECIPNGLPTPALRWQKKDGRLEESSGQLSRYNHQLRFRSVQLSDDGEYECRASNSQGNASHTFTVTVEAAPYWVKAPASLMFSPGETVRLDCQAEGIPTPNITWSINGEVISDVDREPRRSITDGVLILRDVVLSDTAVYQCEAANDHGVIILNTQLHVVSLPPQILTSDGLLYRVIEGDTVMMHCQSFGSPRPHITWENEEGQSLMQDLRASLMTNGTVVMSDVGYEDDGSFTCSVMHSNVSIRAHLEVFNRTVILAPPTDVRVHRGSAATLSCSFRMDARLPSGQVVWRKDGHKVKQTEGDTKYMLLSNWSLVVTNVQLKDSGRYSCEVITDMDHVNASGSITVIARPDPPKALKLTVLNDYDVSLSWIPGDSHNSPISEFVVWAREEQHQEEEHWSWTEWTGVAGNVNHVKLRLHPFCTYRFRVTAVNEVGHSPPSEPSEHRSTLPAAPSKNPSGVRSEPTDTDTLLITWDEMKKHLHNGPAFMYKVSWRRAGATGGHWNSTDVESAPLLIRDAGTYSQFEIKVQAVNSLGEGPEPEVEVGRSGEDKPEDPPTGITTSVTNSTVRVHWKEAKRIRGLLLGYKIHLLRLGPQTGRGRRSLGKHHHDAEGREQRAEPGRGRDSRLVVVHGAKTSGEVTGLRLYSRYELSVTAFNSKGEGPHSTPHHFSTPEGAPGPPASLRLESPTERSLILFWTPPLEPNGILQGYVIRYQQEVESRDSLSEIELISDPSVTHKELHSLDPSSHYVFNVFARTATGEGPPVTRRGATLLDGVPPSNVSISPSSNFINLTWVPGERDRNHGFHLRYLRKSSGTDWSLSEVVNSTQGFYSLTGLQPGSEYRLQILHDNNTRWEKDIWTLGPAPTEIPATFATRGWLIGLISAIVLLVLILLILCLIKRSKGGKYAVKDKEDKEVDSEARPMKDETFGEYSDAEEKRSDSQPSLCGDSKLGSDDSLAEYGNSVDIQFNEDGSFIGQYSGRGHAHQGNEESSGPTSPVNAVPPPPIAPSMSSILNRPS